MMTMTEEPRTYYNYQRSYELALDARKKLKAGGWKIVDLYKYSKRYWVVEYRK